MVKARTIFIFEGHDKASINRGYKPESYITPRGMCCRINIKAKGLFGKWIEILNIDEKYFRQPKPLFGKQGNKWKFFQGWEIQHVMVSLPDLEPYIADLNINLARRADSLLNEKDMYRIRSNEAEKLNRNAAQKDLLWRDVDNTFDRVGKARNKIYTGDSWYGGLGFGRTMPPPEQ